MRLYFAPFACSLAIRAALDEIGLAAEARLVHEDKLPDGRHKELFTPLLDKAAPEGNWCEASGVDLARWPMCAQYRDRLRRRPSIARAIMAERPILRVA